MRRKSAGSGNDTESRGRAAAGWIRSWWEGLPLTKSEKTLVVFVGGCAVAGLLLLAWREHRPLRTSPVVIQGSPGSRDLPSVEAAETARAEPAFPLDLNTASPFQLQRLPGIGKKLAYRIEQERRTRGPFRSVDDLARVDGLTAKKLAALRPYAVARQLGF